MKDDVKNHLTHFKCEGCGDICKLVQFETTEGAFADVEFGDQVCKLVKESGDWKRTRLEPAFIKPTFSINRYDRDGDMFEGGIYLDFNSTTVRITNSIEGFDAFIAHLTAMRQELYDNIESA